MSKGKDDGALDQALGKQLGGNATSLMIVSGLLAIFALMPGLPFLPFMMAAIGFGVTAYFLYQQSQKVAETGEETEETPQTEEMKIGDSIHSDEIHLEVAPDLVATVLQGEAGD